MKINQDGVITSTAAVDLAIYEEKQEKPERRALTVTYEIQDHGNPRLSWIRRVELHTRAWVAKIPIPYRRLLLSFSLCLLLAVTILLLSCLFILLHFRSQLRPVIIPSGYLGIAQQWTSPSQTQQLLSTVHSDLSGSITPIPCHSHNDYWRRVPVFDALSVGCTSIEADIWLPSMLPNISNSELPVGHRPTVLQANRTLNSLFIDPLIAILAKQNARLGVLEPRLGVYDLAPYQTLVLLLDFKQDGHDLWPLVNAHLQPLRDLGYLRYWNGTSKAIVPGPITVVASGLASESFDLITANETYRDIFADAPLPNLTENPIYDVSNSYYASVSFLRTVGEVKYNGMNSGQKDMVERQVEEAKNRGLLSRYWDTPAWPISLRTKVWRTLVKHNVGVLNVDDLVAATRWDWNFCTIFGVQVCGW